jgi:hypothetical protein
MIHMYRVYDKFQRESGILYVKEIELRTLSCSICPSQIEMLIGL